MKTKTETLAAAMDVLAREIQSGDGVANAAIAEAAARLRELDCELKSFCRVLGEKNPAMALAKLQRITGISVLEMYNVPPGR
jgi:hypothetical protein